MKAKIKSKNKKPQVDQLELMNRQCKLRLSKVISGWLIKQKKMEKRAENKKSSKLLTSAKVLFPPQLEATGGVAFPEEEELGMELPFSETDNDERPSTLLSTAEEESFSSKLSLLSCLKYLIQLSDLITHQIILTKNNGLGLSGSTNTKRAQSNCYNKQLH